MATVTIMIADTPRGVMLKITSDERLPEPGEETPTFLPGEEELEELLARTAELDDEER